VNLYRQPKKNLNFHFTYGEVSAMIPMMAPILDDIRKAIEVSGKTRYRISKDTGISEGHLSELMAGTKGLSIEALERLASYLGLEIVIQAKRPKKGR